jgi:signal recognition particle subunit SRP72
MRFFNMFPDNTQQISSAIAKDYIRRLLSCTISSWTPPNELVYDPSSSRNLTFATLQGSEEHSDILTNLQASQKHLDFIESGYLHALDMMPSSLTKNIESNPPPAQPSTQLAAALVSASVSVERAKPLQKKVRMSRVPAGVVPGVTPPPDPERWLKKTERSTFNHGKRRKGPSGGGGATQGSANVEAAASMTGATPNHGSKPKRKPRK